MIIFVFLAVLSGIAGYYNVSTGLFIGVGWIFWVFVLLFVISFMLSVFSGGFWYGGYPGVGRGRLSRGDFRYRDWENMAFNQAKMRLASGEISEKEYRNIVKLIKSK